MDRSLLARSFSSFYDSILAKSA